WKFLFKRLCSLGRLTEKRMATEVLADSLVEEWKGYVVRISVLPHGCVCLLLSKGHSCYCPRRTGEIKCKSIHGCISDANLSVLNLVIVKKGEKGFAGTCRICKLFNLSKKDDARQYVVRKPVNKRGKKPRTTLKRARRKQQNTKLLVKRMEEANEQCKEQIVNWCWLSSLRASTSKSNNPNPNPNLNQEQKLTI
uniref:Small ribosomal subunit protein eS6 n=1 Tax=Corvus moneduloides TaxID=1196302 RepID=A0A8U7NZ92_CORMO